MQNVGAFFGIFVFSYASIVRRPAADVRRLLRPGRRDDGDRVPVHRPWSDIFWMIPLMGFFQLAIFGGYAIYFPELFPTRLRSTGTSFCYNVGRLIAAVGPAMLGFLTSTVFAAYPSARCRSAMRG